MARTTSHSGQNHFTQIPRAEIERSSFNRSSGLKTTFNSGDLIPIYCDEALPGDTINLSVSTFARMATPLHPIMDNQHLDIFFFAVPNRLLWDKWHRFNGETTAPGSSTDFLIPTIDSGSGAGWPVGSIHDYMGLPVDTPGIIVNALFHRAYHLIWNDWFRAQDIQGRVWEVTDDTDDESQYAIQKRGKRHDYFTSCQPWPQKGDAVTIPIGDTAPVVTTGVAPQFENSNSGPAAFTSIAVSGVFHTTTFDGGALEFSDGFTGLEADLSGATSQTINQLRQAFQIQRLYERDARGGTRYTEILRSHFGVTSPDARLNRPEYLGGVNARINVNPVAQTAEGTNVVGDLTAYVTSANTGRGFVKSFTEHCTIIGLACIRADINYQQGIDRQFSRSTRWDYYWPALSHLGEQAVLNKEIYAQGDADQAADVAVFGYQERYAEYRYKPSKITGEFRSAFAQSLDTWHLAQDFDALPTLSPEFIVEDPPIDRVIAVPSAPQWLLDCWFKVSHARPMPTYGVPGMIDHF